MELNRYEPCDTCVVCIKNSSMNARENSICIYLHNFSVEVDQRIRWTALRNDKTMDLDIKCKYILFSINTPIHEGLGGLDGLPRQTISFSLEFQFDVGSTICSKGEIMYVEQDRARSKSPLKNWVPLFDKKLLLK